MPYYVGGKKIKKVGVLTEPNSYQTDIAPADMQSGTTAVSKGKIITGTGKAFEFASYGSKVIRTIIDSNGVQRKGAEYFYDDTTNVIFVAPSTKGNVVLQEDYLVSITEGEEIKIANDNTTGGELRVYFDGEKLVIYLTQPSDQPTVLRFFVGKDNYL